jgi:F plasmid transfer operon protein TraF
MKTMWLVRAAIAAAAVVVSAAGAGAQTSDAVGVRAQGMGGAFTAVADDATAAWWNPAGLAAGAYFNAIIEIGNRREPATDRAIPAWQAAVRGFSIAYPSLGLSYYRLRVSEIQATASTGGSAADREDGGSANVRLRSLGLSQFGATVGQSLGNHLVIASTLKLIRGTVGTGIRPASGTSLDAADDLEGETEMHPGLDIGAMAKVGSLRLGVMVRNAREMTFGDGAAGVTLERRVRAGVALSSGSNLATVAADVDITRSAQPTGDERRISAGGEAWGATRRIGLRGGVSVNTIGDARPAVSGGVSVAPRSGMFLEVAGTAGSDASRRSWGFALRVTL